MLGTIRDAWRYLFPGRRARTLLIAQMLGMFAVSLMDMLGVAAILPLVQLTLGADVSSGYLGRIDALLGHPGRGWLIVLVGAFLVLAFVLKGVLSLAIKWWSSGFVMRQEIALSSELLERFLREPYLRHRLRTVQEILRDSQDAVGQAYRFVVLAWLSIVGEVFSAIVLMGLLLVVVPLPALAAVAYFSICALVLQRALSSRNASVGEASIVATMESTGAAIAAAVGFREVRLHNRTRTFVGRYRRARTTAAEAGRRATFLQDVPRYVLEIVFIVGIALILGLIMLTAPPATALPSVTLFAGACIRMLPTFTRTVGSLGMIRVGRPALDLVVEQLRHPLVADPRAMMAESGPARRRLEQTPARLDVEGIGFTYPDGDRPVLRDVSLHVAPGTSVALVGGSGSGKTTLVDILLGLIDPDDGAVRVDGEDVRADLPRWFDRVGHVPQDIMMMNATVAENVAFGETGAEIDRERVVEALRGAQLLDVVEELPRGLDQELGEQGTRLSGGQRQRLGIARALYGQPSMLVLDEATSALDNETEARITATLHELRGRMTVLVVAHRLSTVRDVDQLVFFSGGRIAARGTFEEVRRESPEFARLVELGRLDAPPAP